MKNSRVPKFKLSSKVVETLRKRGGAHSTKKGGKGYDRKKINKDHFGKLGLFSLGDCGIINYKSLN